VDDFFFLEDLVSSFISFIDAVTMLRDSCRFSTDTNFFFTKHAVTLVSCFNDLFTFLNSFTLSSLESEEEDGEL
jgi:hypothetical protein